MLEMTQLVSAEGASLVEAQTGALFGDLKLLQRQMQASAILNCICKLRATYVTCASGGIFFLMSR